LILDREKIEGWRSMYVGLRHDPVKDIQIAREEQIAICDLALAHAEALALLRELNDALAIPGWLQPRVDAVLDRAEEKT